MNKDDVLSVEDAGKTAGAPDQKKAPLLKPCPFCGGELCIGRPIRADGSHGRPRLLCMGQKDDDDCFFMDFDTEAEAIAMGNRRAANTSAPVDDSEEQGSARLRDEEHNPDRKRIEAEAIQAMANGLLVARCWSDSDWVGYEAVEKAVSKAKAVGWITPANAPAALSVSLGRGDGE